MNWKWFEGNRWSPCWPDSYCSSGLGLIAIPLFKELDIKTFQLNINAHELAPSYIYCQGSNAKKIERFCTYAHKTCYHLILNRDSKCVKLQIFQKIAWRVWEIRLIIELNRSKTFNNVQTHILQAGVGFKLLLIMIFFKKRKVN